MHGARLRIYGMVALLSGVAARAATVIESSVLDAGGSPATAGTITLQGSIGQIGVGSATVANVTLGAGFWYRVLSVIQHLVPTVTEWGVVCLVLVLAVTAVVRVRRRNALDGALTTD